MSARIATRGATPNQDAPPTGAGGETDQHWSRRMADAMIARHTPAAARWHYEHGLLLWAIDQVGLATGDPRYHTHVHEVCDIFISPDGEIRTFRKDEYNLDQINHGNPLFRLWRESGKARYRRALEALRLQMAHQPRNASGGFWHKLIYPYQMWLDGIYMACPFLARYATTFAVPALYDEVVRQIALITDRACDRHTGLLYHAWDESRIQPWSNPETGVSPHFWGRAIGWYLMALVDVLDELPHDHSGRDTIIAFLRQTAEAVTTMQDGPSGLWWQVLDRGGDKGNYLEASASSMFVYALAKGVRMGYLHDTSLPVAQRGFAGLVERLVTADEYGLPTLNEICAVAGLGGTPYRDGSYAYYVGEPRQPNDYKGVGPFILAALEIEQARHTSSEAAASAVDLEDSWDLRA